MSRAKELCVTGRQVDAAEAVAIGLADEVVPDDELLARSLSLAGQAAKGPVVAHAICKRGIDSGVSQPLAVALDIEHAGFVASFDTEDARRGIGSFLEHGPGRATFVGR